MAERRDVIKSRESIKQAFIDLRKNKALCKITVTKIIDYANISKGTFMHIMRIFMICRNK